MSSEQNVRETYIIHAPLDRVWALSRRVELVRDTLGMKLVGGTTSGFVEGGSRVIWKGWKFGLPTEHHTLITGYTEPHALADGTREAYFQDSQEHGRFKTFHHDHYLRELTTADGPVTLLGDHVQFSLPFGLAGTAAAVLLMRPYVTELVQKRYAALQKLAEGEGWREFVAA